MKVRRMKPGHFAAARLRAGICSFRHCAMMALSTGMAAIEMVGHGFV